MVSWIVRVVFDVVIVDAVVLDLSDQDDVDLEAVVDGSGGEELELDGEGAGEGAQRKSSKRRMDGISTIFVLCGNTNAPFLSSISVKQLYRLLISRTLTLWKIQYLPERFPVDYTIYPLLHISPRIFHIF